MNIDLSKFKNFWWEDAEGNVLDKDPDVVNPPDGAEIYWSCFPCQLREEMNHYGPHPKGFRKFLSKIPVIGKYVLKHTRKTFQHMGTFNCTYGGKISQDTIIAMVQVGGYTLEQAMWVYGKACERCGNALIYKYLGEGNDGYPEDSEEYKNCNTRCQFCKTEEDYEFDRKWRENEKANQKNHRFKIQRKRPRNNKGTATPAGFGGSDPN